MSEGKAKFTQGPWEVDCAFWRGSVPADCEEWRTENKSVMSSEGLSICMVQGDSEKPMEANATLISAAPDMYNHIQKVADRPAETLAMLRREGFVFDNLDDRWQKLAFSLYTTIVELGSESESLLAIARGEDV